ncbi:MAG: hypothetical protein INQ03_16415 [Candidatus Heimdallarchaeota archaeon]|nr:hypothetical protein [Candidatus Heimdallarchaeota archaeon]
MKRINLIFLMIFMFSLLMVSKGTVTSIAEPSDDTTDQLLTLDQSDEEDEEDEEDDNTETSEEEDEDDEKEDEEKDSDGDGVEDDVEEAYEREIELEIDSEKFKIKSSLKTEDNKDEFELEFDIGSDDNAEIKMKFKSESENAESELEYKVKFDEIIEFTDLAAIGYENETIVSSYEIGKSGWNALSYTENQDLGLIEIIATTSDGVFSLNMRIANNFLQDDGVVLSPTSLKIDVTINQFSFVQNDTKLAIKTHIKSSSEMERDEDTEDEQQGTASSESEVEISTTSTAAFFSWAQLAMADDQEVNVISSALTDSTDEESESSNKIYFTFDAINPTKIVWDPKLGVVSEASLANIAAALGVDVSEGFTLAGFELWVIVPLFAFGLLSKRIKHSIRH